MDNKIISNLKKLKILHVQKKTEMNFLTLANTSLFNQLYILKAG